MVNKGGREVLAGTVRRDAGGFGFAEIHLEAEQVGCREIAAVMAPSRRSSVRGGGYKKDGRVEPGRRESVIPLAEGQVLTMIGCPSHEF